MVSVLYKELDYKVESSSVQEVLGHAGRGLESNPNFQLGNNKTIPDQSTRLVLQPWLINTVYHLLLKNS